MIVWGLNGMNLILIISVHKIVRWFSLPFVDIKIHKYVSG